MRFYEILAWFKRNLKEIRLSQRKTLAFLVYGLMRSDRAGVAAIGRRMKSKTSPKHNIKRVARFLANQRINVDECMKKMQRTIIHERNKIFIALDWTTLAFPGCTTPNYQTLAASVIAEGRSLPLIFKTYKDGDIKDKQIFYEKELINKIRQMVTEDCEVFIVADRGFGRKPELLKFIDELGFYYIARTKENACIKYNGEFRQLSTIKTEDGETKSIKNSLWPSLKSRRSDKRARIISNFVLYKEKRWKDRWVICTNYDGYSPQEIINIYGKRMTIEQTFRDKKNVDLGFGLKNLRLSSAERYDKMLTVISYAYLFLTLLGTQMEVEGQHKRLMANTVKYRSLSLFQVGKHYLKKLNISLPKLLQIIPTIVFQT